jgi:anti-sigma factor RsiW
MFDYLRNLTKSAEEKQQEALNAYLDDALSPQERQQFEQRLARDADLRLEVEQRRTLQMQMRQMPRRRVPRNFTLDPAVYGRPQRQPLFEFYPVMRAATVLTALFFILALGADLFLTGQGGLASPQGVALMVEETTSDTAVEAPMAAQAVEVTRIITETTVEEGETVAAEAAPMMEAPVAEEMVESAASAVEEEMLPEATPVPQTEDTMTMATDAAEAGDAAAQESAAIEPLPTATPAATQTVLATIDATKSTVPRPEAETGTGERALTTVPTAQPETMGQVVEIEPTTVPTPPPTREPISGLRLLQIGLGVLLVLLGTAVFYVRRQS